MIVIEQAGSFALASKRNHVSQSSLHRTARDLDFLIGAIRAPSPVEDVVQESLLVDRLSVIAGKNHPLAQKKNVTTEGLPKRLRMFPRKMQPEDDLDLISLLDVELPDTGRPIGLTVRSRWQPTQTQARFINLVRHAAITASHNSAYS